MTTPAEAPAPLVEVSWLAAQLGSADLVVLEATVPYGPNGTDESLGRERFAAGHIPGARRADLKSTLSDPSSPFSFTLPGAERLAAALEALGIHDEARVVLYDDFLNMWATRLWWMLRGIGFERAAVLNGGWQAWRASGLPVEEGPGAPSASRGVLTSRPRPAFVGLETVAPLATGQTAGALACALPESYFVGRDAVGGRAGHIPGSVSVPAASLLGPDGRFLPEPDLARRLDGLAGASPAVVYCGGGISATVVAFALHLTGRDDVLVYDGSLEEWNADPARPLVAAAAQDAGAPA